MRKYVVIDTNVLVSGLLTRNEFSPTLKILKLLADNTITPVYSSEIIKEYREVLLRDKFGFSQNTVDMIINDIKKYGLEVSEIVQVCETMSDPKDIVFYAVTLSVQDKAAILVTGNIRHFPVKPFVMLPADFIKLFETG